ncbi:diacylglycerol kinase family protein [Phenylobacterium sp. LjRoot225]|uniref:diacylglycerol/lipid kinase family protein n=1 Tax=Phenylobacterium sp. LjRoot225 TaxID=3342285 RepID=UPI003ED16526
MSKRGAAPTLRRVEVVVNVASGSVAPDAPAEVEKIFADFGINAHVCAPSTEDLTNCLRAAVDAGPELLVVLAGDGTVRAAAELCGPKGPMIAPLPGGTMNMLPHAIYGLRSWQDALTVALAEGEARMLGGGEVEGRQFLVAAILGSPALWGPAREAARYGKARLALMRAQRALRRAFTGRLRYSLDDGPRDKAVGLSFLCPLISRALDEEAPALEAAILDLQGLRDVVSLGFHALKGDWREAPAVHARPCRVARIWASEHIPAILDGEAVRLSSSATIGFRPDIVRVLSLPKALRES